MYRIIINARYQGHVFNNSTPWCETRAEALIEAVRLLTTDNEQIEISGIELVLEKDS